MFRYASLKHLIKIYYILPAILCLVIISLLLLGLPQRIIKYHRLLSEDVDNSLARVPCYLQCRDDINGEEISLGYLNIVVKPGSLEKIYFNDQNYIILKFEDFSITIDPPLTLETFCGYFEIKPNEIEEYLRKRVIKIYSYEWLKKAFNTYQKPYGGIFRMSQKEFDEYYSLASDKSRIFSGKATFIEHDVSASVFFIPSGCGTTYGYVSYNKTDFYRHLFRIIPRKKFLYPEYEEKIHKLICSIKYNCTGIPNASNWRATTETALKKLPCYDPCDVQNDRF